MWSLSANLALEVMHFSRDAQLAEEWVLKEELNLNGKDRGVCNRFSIVRIGSATGLVLDHSKISNLLQGGGQLPPRSLHNFTALEAFKILSQYDNSRGLGCLICHITLPEICS